MPIAHHGPVKLHYETVGSGPPVLLIMGLAVTARIWWRTAPVLVEAGFQVLTFDNRGVGRSGRVPGPYTTADLADDAVSILDAAGLERAHVYGFSLGGMIAQQVAIRHPDRVARLVLGGSSPGGDAAIAPTAEMVAFLQRRAAMPIEEGVWASVPYNYGRQTRRERAQVIGEDIAVRLEDPYEPETYSAHLAAVLNHDATDGLGCIAAPTLVVHGDEDVLLDPGNARFIAEGIPGAALHLVPGGSHFYFTDDPSADGEIAKFLHAGEPV